MDEREFEAWAKSTLGFWIDNDEPRVLNYVSGGCIPASSTEIAMWDALQAARRITPDRDSIIEECAKVCERVAAERNIVEMRSGAELCVGAIRAMKAAPTSDKGGA